MTWVIIANGWWRRWELENGSEVREEEHEGSLNCEELLLSGLGKLLGKEISI